MKIEKIIKDLNIEKIIIWGLKSNYHSHHFIHLGFFKSLNSSPIKVLWLNDKKTNNKYIDKKTLVIAVDVESNNLDLNKNAFYCTHNLNDNLIEHIQDKKLIKLQVITNKIYDDFFNESYKLKGIAFFNKKTNTLYQSWGSSIGIEKFSNPIIKKNLKFEFFIGSIWNNNLNQGNFGIINEYKKKLNLKKINFIHCQHIPEFFYSSYIKNSKYAATIIGEWQKNNGYTPCRIFKAIASGRLGIINSTLSMKIYNFLIGENSIDDLIDKYESMSESKMIELIKYQQNQIIFETYETKIVNILNALKIKNS